MGALGCPSRRRSPASVAGDRATSKRSTGVHAASPHDQRAGAPPPRCFVGVRMTNIGPVPRMTLRFDRLCSGHYRATIGETPHRWIYDITRVTRRVWRVAQTRLQRGCDIIVVDTRDVATLKSGMQWCEDAARNDGAFPLARRPLLAGARRVRNGLPTVQAVLAAASVLVAA